MKSEGSEIDPRRADRLGEASDWLLRLEQPTRVEADYTDWLRWCDADPENLAAFETVQRKWQALDALKFDSELSNFSKRALLDQEADRLFDGLARREAREIVGRPSRRGPVSARMRWSIAAGLGAIALALTLLHFKTSSTEIPVQVAAALTNRAATLPDGSRMILGAQGRVDVNFNGPQRNLDLSNGEAYFKVKHDRMRPFVVRAGEVSVTAIGTAFDVRRAQDQVTITVEEGTVDVSSRGLDGKDTVWRAEAGYQVTYSTAQRTASIASVNPAAVLAWRNGDLAYRYEPLGTVVEDLNRYSTHRIVIADPAVAKIPFSGTAFASSLNGWLAGIEQAYPVTVNRTASGDIVLSARE